MTAPPREPVAITEIDRVIERLQMDIDDGGRPDMWSMQSMQECLRKARAVLAAPAPSAEPPAQGELQTEYQAGWDNCYAMAEPAIAALRAERDEAHSAVDAWIDLLRATEAERDALRAECADLRRRLDEHIDDKERALRLSAKESTRLTTEVERLRECVRVADKMRWSTRCQQYEWPTYDAARAKVKS